MISGGTIVSCRDMVTNFWNVVQRGMLKACYLDHALHVVVGVSVQSARYPHLLRCVYLYDETGSRYAYCTSSLIPSNPVRRNPFDH
jgi:hypothetical protein